MAAKRMNSRLGKTESIEEMFKCPICLDDFKDPRYLPCSHIFCFECLARLEQRDESGHLRCPQCRSEPSPMVSAESLPRALIAKQMVERIPYLKATSESDKESIIDTVVTLLDKRKKLKEREEREAREGLRRRKEEIERNVQREASLLVEQVTGIIKSREDELLREVRVTHAEALKSLEEYSKKAEDSAEVKSWMRSNILNDDMVVVEPPVEVLPLGVHKLMLQFGSSQNLNAIKDSLDPGESIRKLGSISVTAAADAGSPNARRRRGPIDWDESCLGPLRSVESGMASIDVDPSSVGVHSQPEVSTLPAAEQSTMPVYRACDPEAKDAVNAPVIRVSIQQWERGPQRGKARRARIASETLARGGSPRTTRRLVSESAVDESLPPLKQTARKSFSNDVTWQATKRIQDFVVKRTTSDSPFPRISVDTTTHFTAAAIEGQSETKLWVFSNEGFNRRRHPMSSNTQRGGGSHTLVGVGSLRDESGWCLFLADRLLVFDFYGVLSREHAFPDFTFLCAVSHSTERMIFINDAYQVGTVSLRGGDHEIQIFDQSQQRLSGMILAMASSEDSLFVAQADGRDEDGRVVCFSGLKTESLRSHPIRPVINPPSGFADVSHPRSICCDGNGKLFVLWRDGSNRKGVILEYGVTRQGVLQNIVLEEASDVHAITCGPIGQLVTSAFQ